MERHIALFLIGECGSGKSTLANVLSQSTDFNCGRSASSVTQFCQVHTKVIKQTRWTIIDTPGLSDTIRTREQVHKEIQEFYKNFQTCNENAEYCVGLVVGCQSRITESTLKDFAYLGSIFGLQFYSHTILFWTHVDLLKVHLEDTLTGVFAIYFAEADESLLRFIRDVKGAQFLTATTRNQNSFQIMDESNFEINAKDESAQSEFLLGENVINYLLNNDKNILTKASNLVLRGKKGRRQRQREYRMKQIENRKEDTGVLDHLKSQFSMLTDLFNNLFVTKPTEENKIEKIV